ncbi:MAG: hypothetical protein AB8A39_02005, partial [Prochlorococcus sp.]
MTAAPTSPGTPAWNVADSAALYGLERWGHPYFS